MPVPFLNKQNSQLNGKNFKEVWKLTVDAHVSYLKTQNNKVDAQQWYCVRGRCSITH